MDSIRTGGSPGSTETDRALVESSDSVGGYGDAADVLLALDRLRQDCLKKLLLRVAIGAVLVGAIAALMMTVPVLPNILTTLTVSAVAGLLIWAFWAHVPLGEFRDAYHARFVPELLRRLDGCRYEGSGRLPLEWISDSDIVPACNIYDTAHMVSGIGSRAGVQFAEARCTRFRARPGRHRIGATHAQAFGGLVLLLSLPKAFGGKTALIPDPGPLFRLFGDAPAWGNLIGPRLKTPHGNFEVFATGAAEAKALIDRPLAAQLARHAASLGGRKVRVAWFDAQILLLLPLKHRLFRAPSIVWSLNSGSLRALVDRDVGTILEMAELLLARVKPVR